MLLVIKFDWKEKPLRRYFNWGNCSPLIVALVNRSSCNIISMPPKRQFTKNTTWQKFKDEMTGWRGLQKSPLILFDPSFLLHCFWSSLTLDVPVKRTGGDCSGKMDPIYHLFIRFLDRRVISVQSISLTLVLLTLVIKIFCREARFLWQLGLKVKVKPPRFKMLVSVELRGTIFGLMILPVSLFSSFSSFLPPLCLPLHFPFCLQQLILRRPAWICLLRSSSLFLNNLKTSQKTHVNDKVWRWFSFSPISKPKFWNRNISDDSFDANYRKWVRHFLSLPQKKRKRIEFFMAISNVVKKQICF